MFVAYLVLLSVLANSAVAYILTRPYRPEHLLVAPVVIFDTPDLSLDWRGLV